MIVFDCSLIRVAIFSCALQVAAGCEKPETFEERAARISKIQSEGVDDTIITVKRAYDYSGYSYHDEKPGHKRIAVDVEFDNPNSGLDLDDVEIIDNSTSESLGSFPGIYLLTSDGEIADQSKWPPQSPNELRVLLVYQVPESTDAIGLRYWGKDVTTAPVKIAGTGPEFVRQE